MKDFWEGVMSIFNIFGPPIKNIKILSDKEAKELDTKTINSYWYKTGEDIETTIEEIMKKYDL